MPTPGPAKPTPAPAPKPPIKQGERVVGYITSWDHYSHGPYAWTDEIANMLTHINYAFATISYSQTLDTYYVDMPDPWADAGDCMGAADCYGQEPDCLEIIGATACGSATAPTVNLAPYIGAPSAAGTACNTECINNGGSPVSARTPPCSANLDTFTHAKQTDPKNWSSPSVPTVCGLYNKLLNPKSGVRAKYPHLRMVLSIGGWYDSNFYSLAVQDKYRPAFVKSVMKFVTAFGYDGVDFDWEYPGFEHGGEPVPGGAKKGDPEDTMDCDKETCQLPSRKHDGANYAKFLTELRAAFTEEEQRTNRAEPFIISMAGPAGQDKLDKLELETMCKAFTYVNVMAYDMHGSFDAKTNHQAPIHCTPGAAHGNPEDTCYSVDNAVKAYIKAGCKAEQLNIGLPFYAHMYAQVPKGDSGDGLYQNHTGPSESICQTKPDDCVPTWKIGGAKWEQTGNIHYDEKAGASYAYDGQNFYSFDDDRSIKAKHEYSKAKGLGGLMYWFIGADDASNTLLKAINKW
jgi:chitinase